MNGKKTIRVLPKRLLLIGAIVLVIAVFGRLRTFAGGLIGQASEDGSMVFDGAADITTEGEEAVLESGEKVFELKLLHFPSPPRMVFPSSSHRYAESGYSSE